MIDQNELREEFKRVRAERKLSFRQVARQAGVSASTLQRFEVGGRRLSFNNIPPIRKWLGHKTMEPGASIRRVRAGSDTMAAIKEAIMADENLTRKTAEALCELMRTAYEGFTETKEQRR
jgi:transcriptional regulator with XRE-family HTH domain